MSYQNVGNYHQVLPLRKGKPKEIEWKVYAALVAVEDEEHKPENESRLTESNACRQS